MAVSIDGLNKIITLESGVTDVAASDLYSDWKDWVGYVDNSKWEQAFETVGGEPLTPGINAGSYFFIRNDLGWRIRPPEEDTTIYINGNLTPKDSSLPILISTTGNYSVLVVGLQPITQSVESLLTLQQSTNYLGVVRIDMFDGSPGTSYPIGTASAPVNNWEDALIIANNIGIEGFQLHGSITFTGDFINSEMVAFGANSSINFNNQKICGSNFNGLLLTGGIQTNDTGAYFYNCQFYKVDNLKGDLKECVIDEKICFNSGTNILSYCFAGVNGAELCLKGLNTNLIIRNWSGPLTLSSGQHPSGHIIIDSFSSEIVLDETMTDGTVVVYGVGDITDNTTGTNLILDTNLLQSERQRRIEQKVDNLTAISL